MGKVFRFVYRCIVHVHVHVHKGMLNEKEKQYANKSRGPEKESNVW